jgi:Ca-activated chloride channel homolog
MSRSAETPAAPHCHVSWIRLLLLLAAIALHLLVPRPAGSSPTQTSTAQASPVEVGWEPGPPVTTSDLGAGECLMKRGSELFPLPVLATDVKLDITGLLVHGRLTQSFHNPSRENIEVVYVFPLPERAAVNRMRIRIGKRVIESELQEREEARRTFNQARSQGRRAALLESERPNLFTSSVANITPGETIEITLEYIQELDYDEGEFSLTFPLTFTPRYTPPGSATTLASLPTAAELDRLVDTARVSPPFAAGCSRETPRATIGVSLNAGFPLTEVRSSSHQIRSSYHDDRQLWRISPRDEDIPADRDFILSWRPQIGNKPQATVFHEEFGGEDYLLLMLLPPDSGDGESAEISTRADNHSGNGPAEPGKGNATPQGINTETLFVVDISGSMDGPSIVQARRALLAAIDRLQPDDGFNLLAFNQDSRFFADRFVPATDENLRRGRHWVTGLQATGGTQIMPALRRAYAMAAFEQTETMRRIILLTDAAVSNERAVLTDLTRNLDSTRLHTVGIGHAPNRYLMRKMATYGRGLSVFVTGDEQVDTPIDSFLRRIGRPAMSDLWLGWQGVKPAEVYPARLPDLHLGEALFISARLEPGSTVTAEASVALGGSLPDGKMADDLLIGGSVPSGAGVATRWARTRIGSLMDQLNTGADPAEIRAQVIETATPFNLVTKYTSLVAVDRTPVADQPPQRRQLPNTLPRGSRLGDLPAGGTLGPLRLLMGSLLGLLALTLYLVSRRGRS